MFQFEDDVAEKVNVAGEFNGWNQSSLPLSREGGKFVLVVPINEGKYKYKYVIDGVWMTGDDLTLNIIRRDGRLYIYPRQPYLRFPFSSKVDFDGYYLFLSKFTDDVDGAGGKMRISAPRNDIDLNFDIHPTDILHAWAQLNVNTVNNDDKVNLDEAYLELTMGKFTLRPFETHWNIEFDDPFRALDAYVQNFDDEIYLTDDERPFYHEYGRYARGFSGDVKAGKWLGQFFFSNKVRLDQSALDEDLMGFRVKHSGRWITWGLTYTQWQIPNGIKADENNDGQTTEKTLLNLDGRTIEYPEGSGSFYQAEFIRQVRPGGQNRKIQTGVDAAVTFGSWKLFTELLSTQSDAAALAYSLGAEKAFGFAYGHSISGSAAAIENTYGEQSDGLSLLLGLIYRGRTWANEFNFRFYNYRAKTFGFSNLLGVQVPTATQWDTGLTNVTPEWFELIHRLELNRTPNSRWGIGIESRYVSRSELAKGNVFYKERIAPYRYLFAELPWAKTTLSERMEFSWKLTQHLTYQSKLDYMKVDTTKKFGIFTEHHATRSAMPQLSWRFAERWQADAGLRYVYYKLSFADTTSTPLGTGSFSQAKPYGGIRYEWSKLFHIRLWYGLDPYVDEDKKLGAAWRIQDLFEPSAEGFTDGFGATVYDILNFAEKRFDRESVFGLQAELRF